MDKISCISVLGLFLLCSFVVSASERKRYDGYKVLQVTPVTRNQLDLFRMFQHKLKIDFWQEPSRLNAEIQFMISPQLYPKVAQKLIEEDIPYVITRENVQEKLDEDLKMYEGRVKKHGAITFDINQYNNYSTIMEWLQEAKSKCPSGCTCTTESIGKSIENRDLIVFKITKPGTNRKTFWSDSLIHAREWLAGATLLKILNIFLTGPDQDAAAVALLDKYDFSFLPVMNPDGYVYSHDVERFWRKSRNVNAGSECMGTDLNRNYDQKWMHDGSSNDPCSDIYAGSGAGSEPETQAVQNYVNANGKNMLAFVSIHTAAQMWLFPFGNTKEDGIECERSRDFDAQMRVANAAADATENTHSTLWQRGTICETIYAASGGTCDYAYGKGGVVYSYTPELRGPGFDPSEEAIQPSFEEVWNAYKAMISSIENP